ncbi:uncharacterized protein MYCFIDRAFT_174594 [Pseudocercospora fijiensis CIRAD86]|uniref:Uncharacterized protein n=1 Tax=Pseudocercospora fijiensis (strain CIRAD86) TaxID=383855 RepID=M3B153_PSEFD|nr:uncharacterized protein MYCFIDRAFT_174594 [Pseudocercospora fijiensis CIRAD86]EME83118.1 hypothetical protein MYCFIDRAFT_174594 [Pseudocercospora fijiensis CIRAD86]
MMKLKGREVPLIGRTPRHRIPRRTGLTRPLDDRSTMRNKFQFLAAIPMAFLCISSIATVATAQHSTALVSSCVYDRSMNWTYFASHAFVATATTFADASARTSAHTHSSCPALGTRYCKRLLLAAPFSVAIAARHFSEPPHSATAFHDRSPTIAPCTIVHLLDGWGSSFNSSLPCDIIHDSVELRLTRVLSACCNMAYASPLATFWLSSVHAAASPSPMTRLLPNYDAYFLIVPVVAGARRARWASFKYLVNLFLLPVSSSPEALKTHDTLPNTHQQAFGTTLSTHNSTEQRQAQHTRLTLSSLITTTQQAGLAASTFPPLYYIPTLQPVISLFTVSPLHPAVKMSAVTKQTKTSTTVIPWKCSDRLCNSGQTYQNRNEVGRKVVSDFFGRNKNATKAIDDDVWHWQCRKGYQRAKYAADKGSAIDQKTFYMTHLRDQLIRIKLWRPEATFTIQLSKPAKTRLDRYHSILRRNGNDIQDATNQIAVPAKAGKSSKPLALALADGVKPDHAEHIDSNFSGQGRATDFILDTIFPWIEQEFSSGAMTVMPPVEFLINEPQPGEVTTDPATNYERWTALLDGAVYGTDANSKKRKASQDDGAPAAAAATTPKRRRLILKVSPPSPAVSPRSRPPIKLSLKKPAARLPPAPEPFVDPFALERERDEAAARELLRLREEKPLPRLVRPGDSLPLYVPPPPPVPGGGRAALRARLRMREEESGEESGDGGDLAGPIMSRGMVFAAAKGKKKMVGERWRVRFWLMNLAFMYGVVNRFLDFGRDVCRLTFLCCILMLSLIRDRCCATDFCRQVLTWFFSHLSSLFKLDIDYGLKRIPMEL